MGTPLENSVLDLWSIFDFLMPGYLGRPPISRSVTNCRLTGIATPKLKPDSPDEYGALSCGV
jgi:hypothetical protein